MQYKYKSMQGFVCRIIDLLKFKRIFEQNILSRINILQILRIYKIVA